MKKVILLLVAILLTLVIAGIVVWRIKIGIVERKVFTAAEAIESNCGENYETAMTAYIDYLDRFPCGAFVDRARDKIERDLINKIDEREWRVAKRRNTIAGFSTYLEKCPKGKYRSFANDMIDERTPTRSTENIELIARGFKKVEFTYNSTTGYKITVPWHFEHTSKILDRTKLNKLKLYVDVFGSIPGEVYGYDCKPSTKRIKANWTFKAGEYPSISVVSEGDPHAIKWTLEIVKGYGTDNGESLKRQ